MKLSNLKWNAEMGDLEPFPEGITAPRRITATASGHDPDYDLELEIELERGRYVMRSLTCRARRGKAVSSEGVTDLPIPKILRIIVGRVLGNPLVSGFMAEHAADKQGPTDEALRRVAAVYRISYLLGLPPTESVASDLALPRSTAGRWVQMARRRGFLGPAEPRRAGERARPRRKA